MANHGCEVHVWSRPIDQQRDASSVTIHTEAGCFSPPDLKQLGRALDAFAAPRRLLVQWVPHGYGYRSMNLLFCLWLARRASRGDAIVLMVHEPFIDLKPGPIRLIVLALVHRLMTIVLLRSAAHVWVSTPAWEPLLRPYALGRDVRIEWLPIPACVRPRTKSGQSLRNRFVLGGETLVGHFGSYGQEVSTLLAERLPSIMESGARPSLLLIGAGGEAFRDEIVARHPAWADRVHATGYVPPTDLADHLEACDLFVQPYPDGITSRRTSAMACLSHGRPVVTTSGHLTEELWAESGAVVLANVSEPDSFAAAATGLLEDSATRLELGTRGQSLYYEKFDIARTINTLAAF
jgi:glycosyltransferase involved in cell wall biosynthesis